MSLKLLVPTTLMLSALIATSCGFSVVEGEISQGDNATRTTLYSFPDTCEEHANRTAQTLITIASLLENENQLSYMPGGQDENYTPEGAQNFRENYPELSEHTLQMQNLARTKNIICESEKENGEFNKDPDMQVIETLGDSFENLTLAGQKFLSERVAINCDIAGIAMMNRSTERLQYLTWENLGFSPKAALVCEQHAPMHPESNLAT